MRSTVRPFVRLAAAALVAVVAAPFTLHAQSDAPTDSSAAMTLASRDSVILVAPVSRSIESPAAPANVTPITRGGAPMTGLRSAMHTREAARALIPTAAATRANLGQARALMVVGAAALITGAIIGGDPGTIIMVGGAVIGLYGLYEYLQ